MPKENPATKKYGPLPLWGWGVVALGTWWLYEHVYKGTSKAPTSSPMTNAPASPPVLSGYWLPGSEATGAYPGPSVTPVFSPNPSPTPGSQGGMSQPGGTPPTLPPVLPAIRQIGGSLLDPTTGRPIYSGPNGEGGYAWTPGSPIPANQQTYQMPDGRWASFVPNTNIQNGNRVALGLTPLSSASSTAPGANPAAISYLSQVAGGGLG